jgi:hypothetical protein
MNNDQQVVIENKLYDVVWIFSDKTGKAEPTLEEAVPSEQERLAQEALV